MTDSQLPPETPQPQPQAGVAYSAPAYAQVPQGLCGWMLFVGIMTILTSLLNILSCVGAISGILMLVAGISIIGARTSLLTIDRVDANLLPFLLKIKTFFACTGWVYLLTLLLIAVALLFFGGTALAGFLAMIAEAR